MSKTHVFDAPLNFTSADTGILHGWFWLYLLHDDEFLWVTAKFRLNDLTPFLQQIAEGILEDVL